MLSFKEIIEKIDGLEKKLSETPSYSNSVAPSAIAEGRATWDKKIEEGNDPEEVDDLSPEDQWKKFMNYLKSKNASMSNVLCEWRLKAFTGNIIELIRGESAFSSVYLDDEERMSKLTAYCSEFFGKDLKIKIIRSAPVNKIEQQSRHKKDEARQKKIEDMPAPVQDVLKIFNGEIKSDIPPAKKRVDENNKIMEEIK